MKTRKLRKKLKKPQDIGWCECVDLPGLGLERIKAKIDSGAATSSIHATRIRPVEVDGEPHVEFWFRAHKGERAKRYRAPVHAMRKVRSSNGQSEFRYVIETTMQLGKLHWLGHLTLANRGRMTFPILIGRRALRRGFLVNCRKRYMLGPPEESDR
ncbi:ATP-dependent zinc protease family protein [Alterisphingorhabdus coralli]|uniref:RimK/LysX family protein n=1 Tax=Alterisphingorhabdus coralli TaxID=3071408 RepID=A0AA97HZZ1_9SPHN|nr:RimK/LysX family protein [Parasphingorhabdus sp. SCSIO 66989]WOE74342.1 RimK/LysX family protein [Parasphingorhabdus sp. SCSIO 66989]